MIRILQFWVWLAEKDEEIQEISNLGFFSFALPHKGHFRKCHAEFVDFLELTSFAYVQS